MSTLVTTNLKHTGATGNNIVLDSSGNAAFADGSASAPSITNDGDTNTGIYFPAADNIGFATNGVIRGRWTTDGLCFGSDTAAANALDDYEEGTWTPTLGGNTTYTTQAGKYTKIGNFVYVTGRISVNSIGTGSTTVLQGFPFTAGGVAGNTYAGSVAFFTDTNTNIVSFYLRLNPGDTDVTVASLTGAGSAPANNSIFKNSTRLDFAMGYFTS